MIGTESQFRNLLGMSITDKISIRFFVLFRVNEVIKPTTPKTGLFEAKIFSIFDDEIRKERI